MNHVHSSYDSCDGDDGTYTMDRVRQKAGGLGKKNAQRVLNLSPEPAKIRRRRSFDITELFTNKGNNTNEVFQKLSTQAFLFRKGKL